MFSHSHARISLKRFSSSTAVHSSTAPAQQLSGWMQQAFPNMQAWDVVLTPALMCPKSSPVACPRCSSAADESATYRGRAHPQGHQHGHLPRPASHGHRSSGIWQNISTGCHLGRVARPPGSCLSGWQHRLHCPGSLGCSSHVRACPCKVVWLVLLRSMHILSDALRHSPVAQGGTSPPWHARLTCRLRCI